MKYILLTCCLLVGCSKNDAPSEEFTPSRPASQPAAASTELPADVEVALSVLLGNRKDEAKVRKASQILHAFEESVPSIEKTKQNIETKRYFKEIAHYFPKAGVTILYSDGKVVNATRTMREVKTSNK